MSTTAATASKAVTPSRWVHGSWSPAGRPFCDIFRPVFSWCRSTTGCGPGRAQKCFRRHGQHGARREMSSGSRAAGPSQHACRASVTVSHSTRDIQLLGVTQHVLQDVYASQWPGPREHQGAVLQWQVEREHRAGQRLLRHRARERDGMPARKPHAGLHCTHGLRRRRCGCWPAIPHPPPPTTTKGAPAGDHPAPCTVCLRQLLPGRTRSACPRTWR